MNFSNPLFFVLLASVAIAIKACRSNHHQKIILILSSIFFYALWDYRYVALLLVIGLVDYFAAKIIVKARTASRRTWALSFALIFSLSVLGYFKYLSFIFEQLNFLFSEYGAKLIDPSIILPVGISFYTFKSMSYTIDVYRKEIPPAKNLRDYLVFLTFFPELVAGPIVRASVLMPQLQARLLVNREGLWHGLSLILLGLTKKILVADRLGSLIDPVFETPQLFSASTLWVAIIGYSFQIYGDFSGYSDIALGAGKILGISLPENFNRPYSATNVSEFWRRWHITLSSWLRDYLYIPMGGNRLGEWRGLINLLVTMLIGGLWHGANWAFVVWGAIHGIALVVHRIFKNRYFPATLGWLTTYMVVLFAWIPFRVVDLSSSFDFFRGLFDFDAGKYSIPILLPCLLILPLAISQSDLFFNTGKWGSQLLVKVFGATRIQSDTIGEYWVFYSRTFFGKIFLIAWILLIFFFSATNLSPFIYFQF